MQLTASKAAGLDRKTLLEIVTEHTLDISQYLDFGWYDWVWYHDNVGYGKVKLGKFLGIAPKLTNIMTFSILTEKGRIVSCGTVSHITELEKKQGVHKPHMKLF